MARESGGFTLVETLAALAVFSIAAMGLISMTGNATRSARHLETRFLAQVVAENAMADAISDPRPMERGVETGGERQRGRDFEWTRSVADTGRDGLVSVEVAVRAAGEAQVLAQLQALKSGAR